MQFLEFLYESCPGVAVVVFAGLVLIYVLRRERRAREDRETEADDEDFEAPDVWK